VFWRETRSGRGGRGGTVQVRGVWEGVGGGVVMGKCVGVFGGG
jgi:hypothetical protein